MKTCPFQILRGKLIYDLIFDIIILNPKGKYIEAARSHQSVLLPSKILLYMGICERQQARNTLPIDFIKKLLYNIYIR